MPTIGQNGNYVFIPPCDGYDDLGDRRHKNVCRFGKGQQNPFFVVNLTCLFRKNNRKLKVK